MHLRIMKDSASKQTPGCVDDAGRAPVFPLQPVSCFIEQLKVGFLLFKNFSYILVDASTRHAAIVDPAWEYGTIVSAIDRLNVTLTSILLTHSHPDHTNCVKPLLKRYPAEVYMSREEIDYYRFRCERLNAVRDREVIPVGDTPVACLLTPGHTAGGACYHARDALFTGDTLFSEGCGICNVPGGDAEKMFESIQMIKRTIDRDVRIYPAHSFGMEQGRTLRALMRDNIYLQIERKELFVGWRMRSGFSGAFNFR